MIGPGGFSVATKGDFGEGSNRRRAGVWRLLLSGALLLSFLAGPAVAARSRPKSPPAKSDAEAAWITINADTGDVLSSQDPDRLGAPASMTKMMLALLIMEAVRDGQVTLAEPVRTSALASKMGGSQVFLKSGEAFPVQEMMAALLIGSANDAAAVLAERLGGSIPGAVSRMNDRAAELGLSRTRFASVHGLPPGAGQEGDVSTPRDMARLSQELVKFPEILRWTSTAEAPFRQGAFILENSNQLIGRFPGADGLKTGHFREAGFNLAATAVRGGLRLITVVMGAASNRARVAEAARLLEEGFRRYVEVTVAKAGQPDPQAEKEDAELERLLNKNPKLANAYSAKAQRASELIQQGNYREAAKEGKEADKLLRSDPAIAAHLDKVEARRKQESAKSQQQQESAQQNQMSAYGAAMDYSRWGVWTEYLAAASKVAYRVQIVLDAPAPAKAKGVSRDRAEVAAFFRRFHGEMEKEEKG